MIDFIINSWIRSQISGDDFYKSYTDNDWFMKWKKIQLNLFLTDQKVKVFVINDKEEVEEVKDLHSNKGIILAYLVVCDDHILYCYTKKLLRRKGYVLRLLKKAGVVTDNEIKCRAMTKSFIYFCKKNNFKIKYYPLLSSKCR